MEVVSLLMLRVSPLLRLFMHSKVSLLTCFHSKSNLRNFKSNFYLSLFVQCENGKKSWC